VINYHLFIPVSDNLLFVDSNRHFTYTYTNLVIEWQDWFNANGIKYNIILTGICLYSEEDRLAFKLKFGI
jgi:hypothetical protein